MNSLRLIPFGLLSFSLAACGASSPGFNMSDEAPIFATESNENVGDSYTRAVAYHHGLGVAENHELAKKYYEKAIQEGQDTRAMNELAVLYLDDDTLIQNFPKAMQLFTDAAQQGNSSSRYNLGLAYYYGFAGVTPNQARGLDLMGTSANQGNLRAQSFIINWMARDGRIDIKTNPVLRQRVQAWADKGMISYWDISTRSTDYQKLWDRFFSTDLKDRSVMLSDILAVESGCDECTATSQNTIARKLNEIQTWRIGSENNDRNDQYNLGIAYLEGNGVPLNLEEGARLIIKSAEAGYVPSQYVLGKLYLEGRGIKKNNGMAYAWFNIAAADTWGYREATWAKAMKDWVTTYLPPHHVSQGQRFATKWLSENRAKAAD